MGKQVGIYIRQLREERGLSQGDVAKLLSLKTAQSISNIERGVSPLPRAKIKKLADVLSVPKSDIVKVVLSEVQDRYSRAAGVQSRSIVLSSKVPAEEYTLLKTLADRFQTAKAAERASLKRQMRKMLSV